MQNLTWECNRLSSKARNALIRRAISFRHSSNSDSRFSRLNRSNCNCASSSSIFLKYEISFSCCFDIDQINTFVNLVQWSLVFDLHLLLHLIDENFSWL